MSRFNDPRHLEAQLARAHEGGLVIDRDRACKRCAYDLTGLRYGARCPECGTVIRFGRSMIVPVRDRMQDAPVWYIRMIRLAFTVLAISSVGVLGLVLVLVGSLAGVGDRATIAGVLLPFCLAWMMGVALLVWRRPSTEHIERTGREEWPIRTLSIGTQALWPCASLLATLPDGANLFGRPWNLLAAQVMTLVAIAGFGAVAWLAAGFSEWMQDEDGAPRLRRRTFWLLALGAVMMLGGSFHVPIPVGSLYYLLVGIDILPLIAAYLVGVMVWTFVGMARASGWALRAKRVDAERTERLRARREAETAAEHERLVNAPIEPPPTYARAPVPKHQHGHGGPDRVAGSEHRR
jgi:hypothetical protein